MSELLCITNRRLCRGDFLQQLEQLCRCAPRGIVLREKDLPEAEYEALAREVLPLCAKHGIPCALHSFYRIAEALQVKAFHAPLPVLRDMSPDERAAFQTLGASCHSVEEAREAEALGCTYITAGHIFDTDCKKGLPGRGLSFLRSVCESVSIPVYAIGGISPENYASVRAAGAAGGCVMSGCMTCGDCSAYFAAFEKAGNSL